MNDKELSGKSEVVFIGNAGLVLLSPYFPRLFYLLHLTDDNEFKNEEGRIKAIFLLQYAAWGIQGWSSRNTSCP